MKTRTFDAWVTMRRGDLEWVYVGPDAEKEAKRSINRPAGESARPAKVRVQLDPPKKKAAS